jgi:hypothetical protein
MILPKLALRALLRLPFDMSGRSMEGLGDSFFEAVACVYKNLLAKFDECLM